jgi:hypothetical protein
MCSRHVKAAVVLGLLFAGLLAATAVGVEDATGRPGGLELAAAVVWRGVIYGAADGLLLAAFPIVVVFAALKPAGRRARIRAGILRSWPRWQ